MTEMRVSKEIEKGTFDISLGASWTSERQLMYHFSKSAVSDAWVEAFNNAMQPLLETHSNYANSSC